MRNTADPSSICSRVRTTRLTPLFNNWNHGSVIRSWLIEPIIAQSEMAFYRYRDSDSIAGKAVALMRHGFGGHPLHRKDEKMKDEKLVSSSSNERH